MNEWFSKASNVFKRDVSETPQPFEVHCECGQQHTGIRRSRQQHIVCKSCGSSLFVLPRDVYPPPHTPKTSPKKKKRRKPVTKTALNSIDLSPETQSPATEEHDSGKEFVSRRKRRHQEQEAAESVVVEKKPNIFVRMWASFTEMVRGFWIVFWEFWTPYRKIALLIFCILGLTVAYSIRQSQLRGAVTIVKTELDEGLVAVGEEDWVEARRHFEKASEAVDLLGREDLEAETIRQFYRETRSLTRLTSLTLFELVEEAESHYVEHGADSWQEKFRMNYQDDWYIIEGALRPSNNSYAVSNGYDLELVFPWAAGQKRRPVNVCLSFQSAKYLPKISNGEPYDSGDGTHTVFSGQLKEFFIGPDGEWAVRFDPETSFFWVNRPTYEATHLQLGSTQTLPDQASMFERQAKWMGVK